MAAIRQELGTGWAIRVAVGMFAMAWLVAFVVRLVGQAMGMA
jgi:Fe2+ transport system protein B